ncbi:hypothetical protein F5X99DRAFT_403673 [Biscogniauxia marginata]|nr:hypothetical protein F5X99DRAFT_403673 [Biscogniauxia marginata]
MPRILLFCTAEEAKPFVPRILSVEKESQGLNLFFLVESRSVQAREDPRDSGMFRSELSDGEGFETDFINASEQDCQSWALQQMGRFNFIEQDIIAILDKRCVTDESLLISFYARGAGIQFPGFDGLLPQEQGKWYTFRIPYRKTFTVHTALLFTAPDVVYPTYFGRKEELTNENGIFDVDRAQQLCLEEDFD